MAKLSLSPKFIKESILLFRDKSLKEIVFGKRVEYSKEERELSKKLKGARKGSFVNGDILHKGKGTVYLVKNALGDEEKESLLLFSEDTAITQGPDLYVYLSTSNNVKKGYGEYLDLGLLKGNKGGQSYVIKEPLESLSKYRSVIIDCKQFAVLFSFAVLG